MNKKLLKHYNNQNIDSSKNTKNLIKSKKTISLTEKM